MSIDFAIPTMQGVVADDDSVDWVPYAGDESEAFDEPDEGI